MRYTHIAGWGMSVPDRRVTNDDLGKLVQTSDKWIRARTGIVERRIAGEGETAITLAVKAAQEALRVARFNPRQVELIIVATFSPDRVMPSTACMVQDALGAHKAAAFDVNAACSGFVYGLAIARSMMASGEYDNALVIGSEVVSHMLNWEDRSTCVLFGDGSGAFLLQASDHPGGILSVTLGADGSGGSLLTGPVVGNGYSPQVGSDLDLHHVSMNGPAVFRFATRILGKAAQESARAAGLEMDDIELFIPHQANLRIIKSAAKQLKLPMDKVFVNLQKYGNTSSASVPLAFCEAIEEGRISPGDHVVMVAFGSGLTWGAATIQWAHALPVPHEPHWHTPARWAWYRLSAWRSLIRRFALHIDTWVDTLYRRLRRRP